MPALENRYDFVFLFDVTNGNPNGDPDAGNLPRLDPETSTGLVTDVCLKRKIRNYVQMVKEEQSPWRIYVKEKAVLAEVRGDAYQAVEGDAKTDEEKINKGREFMCANFYDVRSFGAVMSTKLHNCGQVRGPVQLAFSHSIDPVIPMDISITRMAVETAKEAKDQSGDNRTMGRKAIVPYGLYRCHGFVSAPLAQKTGFSQDDLDLLFEAFCNMFDHDRSAARGEMAARKLVAFKHACKMGKAPAHTLFDRVAISRKEDSNGPPRSFADYSVTVNASDMPQGVEIVELL